MSCFDDLYHDGATELLSRELLELNIHDRNAIHEEIHGVQCLAPDESPEFVKKSLEEFWTALDGLPRSQKTSYERCKRISEKNPKHYAIHDTSFHLRFLRSELFDAKKAATRFANYLNFVNELWGDVALQREIRFSDFSTREAKLLRKGYNQLLPVRDQSGRPVIVYHRKSSSDWNYDCMTKTKVAFYLWNSVSFRDVESQRKGAVFILDCVSLKCVDNNYIAKLAELLKDQWGQRFFAAIPIRIVAMHCLFPDLPFSRILKNLLVLKLSDEYLRLRMRFYLEKQGRSGGVDLYLRYQLKGYGIPVELLPYTESGTVTTKRHVLWTKSRRCLEEGSFEADGGNGFFRVQFPDQPPMLIVDFPGYNDVLFRQGKTMMEHPGNVMFRDLILDYLESEQAWKADNIDRGNGNVGIGSKMGDKTPEAMGYGKHRFLNSWILDQVYGKRQGRFLEWDRERAVWTLMTDLVVIKNKISIVFSKHRNRREKLLSTSATTFSASSSQHQHTAGYQRQERRQSHSLPKAADLGVAVSNLPNSNDDIETSAAYQFLDGESTEVARNEHRCCKPDLETLSRLRSASETSMPLAPAEFPEYTTASDRKRARIG